MAQASSFFSSSELVNYFDRFDAFIHGSGRAQPHCHADTQLERGGVFVAKTLTQVVGACARGIHENPHIFVYPVSCELVSKYDSNQDEATIARAHENSFVGRLILQTGQVEVDDAAYQECMDALRKEIQDKVPRFCRDGDGQRSFGSEIMLSSQSLAPLAQLVEGWI